MMEVGLETSWCVQRYCSGVIVYPCRKAVNKKHSGVNEHRSLQGMLQE